MKVSCKRLAALPIVLLAALTISLSLFGSNEEYGAPFLYPFLNAVFSTAMPLAVAVILARVYLRQGLLGVLLLGCGLLLFSLGGLGSGIAPRLWPHDAVNTSIRIYNTCMLLMSVLVTASAALVLRGERRRGEDGGREMRRLWLSYSGIAAIALAVSLLAPTEWFPAFFVQGQGPTRIRQVVLLSAIILLAVSSTMYMLTYLKRRASFAYWLALGLCLLWVGLCGVFTQTVFGSALNWSARTAQYLGGLYLLVAAFSAYREAARSGKTVAESIRDFFSNSETSYRLLVENSPDLIFRFDRDFRYLYISPSARRLAGIAESFFIGRRLHEIGLAEEDLKTLETAIRQAFEHGTEQTVEVAYETPLGRKDYGCSVMPERDEAGRVSTVLGVARDITGQKRSEAELRRAKADAEAASRAKSEFLANMSHEIRTPMNGILGLSQLLTMSGGTEENREYARMIHQSGQALLDIINDILDLAKIEAGKIELDQSPFKLREIVEETLKPLGLAAQEKGLSMLSSIDPEVPEHLVGDRGRLRQILTNVVGNAVKYTEEGTVAVSVGLWEERSSSTASLLFAVSDTGIGIPRDKQSSIFDSFSQVTANSSHVKYGGTGLGLAISKDLVKTMGGRIWVLSEEGKGSTFCFTASFPLGEADAGSPKDGMSRPEHPEQGLRILVVEDNMVNRILAEELLRKRGHEVLTAENGREAIEALRLKPFDLVLMDVRMPVMDGLEAVRRIRGGEAGDPDIPVVALTAHALKGDQERLLRAGMSDYLSKPIDMEALDRVLGTASRTSREKSPRKSGETERS